MDSPYCHKMFLISRYYSWGVTILLSPPHPWGSRGSSLWSFFFSYFEIWLSDKWRQQQRFVPHPHTSRWWYDTIALSDWAFWLLSEGIPIFSNIHIPTSFFVFECLFAIQTACNYLVDSLLLLVQHNVIESWYERSSHKFTI